MGLSEEAPELPMDLVTEEILTRLRAKSLMRFKCVSKLWLSVIGSKYFSNRFLRVPSPRLYMCFLDHDDNNNSVILSLAPTSTSTTPSSFVVDHDLTIPRMGGYILQNFRGFMCYAYRSMARIYNPATRQLVTLPFMKSSNMIAPPGSLYSVTYYFGHDPVNDQYKVVSLICVFSHESPEVMSENWVFDLKAGGGSWKKAATPPDFSHHLPSRGGVCIDGVIYYMVWINFKPAVVIFDVRSEEFNTMQVPPRDGDEHNLKIQENLALLEYGGKVTLFDQINLKDKGVLALWTMEDAGGKQWSWSCKIQVLQPSQLHLVSSIKFRFRGTTQNGKVLLKPVDFLSPFHILCYDLQSNDMRKIEIKGIPDHWFSLDQDTLLVDLMFMDQSETIMSWET